MRVLSAEEEIHFRRIFLWCSSGLDTVRYPIPDLFNISVDRELDSSIALQANVGNLAVATKLWRQLLKKRPLNTQHGFQSASPPTFWKGDPITLKNSFETWTYFGNIFVRYPSYKHVAYNLLWNRYYYEKSLSCLLIIRGGDIPVRHLFFQ